MPAHRCPARLRRRPHPAVLAVAAAAAPLVSCSCGAFVLVPPHPLHVVPLRAPSRLPTIIVGGENTNSRCSSAAVPVDGGGDRPSKRSEKAKATATAAISRRDALLPGNRPSLAAAATAAVFAAAWPAEADRAVAVAGAPPAAVVGVDLELSASVQRLWDLDVNRLRPGKDYAINIQGGKRAYQVGLDAAPGPLFRGGVDPVVIFAERETYRTFVALLNNYNAQTCTSERMTEDKLAECRRFLRAAMSTPAMRYCYQYCRGRNPDRIPDAYYGEGPGTFEKLLYDIWFKLYRRCDLERPIAEGGEGGAPRPPMAPDSSGFEHVFVGEVKDGKVIGFHNWIQFYLQERMGRVDYRGYIEPRRRRTTGTDADGNVVVVDDSSLRPSDEDQVLTMQFAWNGVEKPVGTSFIGVSPEFELALYTMLFFAGGQENLVALDTGTGRFDLDAKCFKIARGRRVGSCFVECRAHRAGG